MPENQKITQIRVDETVYDVGESVTSLSGTFLRFDAAQTLDEAQKQQARTNTGTLSEADMMVLGGSVENANVAWLWTQGKLSPTTGNVISASNRISTAVPLPISQMAAVRALSGRGWVAALYDSSFAFIALYSDQWSTGGATAADFLANQSTAVYFRLMQRKTDNSSITPASWDGVEILRTKPEIPDPTEWEEVSVLPLAQGRYKQDTTAYGSSDTYYNYRVTSDSVTALPYGGPTKLRWILPPWIYVGWRCGTQAENLNAAYSWYLQSSSEMTAGTDAHLYWRPFFAKYSGSDSNVKTFTITPSELSGVRLFVQRSPSIAESDPDAMELIDSLRRHGYAMSAPALPVIAHTSDIHGDQYRATRFADIADAVGADLMVFSGDICAKAPAQGFGYLHQIIKTHSTKAALCVGNHDMSGAADNAAVYSALIDPVATELAYNGSSSVPWYYRDIGDLRVISVDTFEVGATTNERNHMSSAQLQWLANTMADSNGKYILIIQHSPFMKATDAEPATGYTTFFGNQRITSDLSTEFTDGKPVFDIVDAFIARSSLNRTWTQGGTGDTSITAQKDFSACTGEFVAHLMGHVHCDLVTWAPSTQRQLMLGVTCGTSVWGDSNYPYIANCDDMGRVSGSPSQDAVNLYAIDTTDKTVRIVRAGQHFTREAAERRVMIIPYKEV